MYKLFISVEGIRFTILKETHITYTFDVQCMKKLGNIHSTYHSIPKPFE